MDERGSRIYTRKLSTATRLSKRCSRCETVKPATDFHGNSARRDGLSVYCGLCTSALHAEKRRELRVRTVTHLGGRCRRCGYDGDSRAFAIDHVNGDGGKERKSGRVQAAIWRAALVDEEGRYQLLCANCNVIKRFEQNEHGARVYERAIPTERVVRPDIRHSNEWREHCSRASEKRWTEATPEARQRMSQILSENMKRRWASGEVPNRKKPV